MQVTYWRVRSPCLYRQKPGSVAEDKIIDTEVYHLLKVGHQKGIQQDVCNVGNETALIRVCSSTVKRRIPSPSLLSWIRVSCHVTNAESLHVQLGSQEMTDPNLVPKLVGVRNVYSLGIMRALGLLRDVKMTR